jgi:hypothetical protein
MLVTAYRFFVEDVFDRRLGHASICPDVGYVAVAWRGIASLDHPVAGDVWDEVRKLIAAGLVPDTVLDQVHPITKLLVPPERRQGLVARFVSEGTLTVEDESWPGRELDAMLLPTTGLR